MHFPQEENKQKQNQVRLFLSSWLPIPVHS